MPNQIFVIGIGGTGMRCLESFIHLCAIGMFDNTEVNMLALDTDKENGNYERVKELTDAYLRAKGNNVEKHTVHENTFFSAKIKYYQFSPDYSDKGNFEFMFNYDDVKDAYKERADIADLVLTKNARQFDLRHGYRAQTYLGSMLMYHSILDEIKNDNSSDLYKFIQELSNATTSGKPRVFIFGSVFGGTGASSISIIPKALTKAASYIAIATDLEQNIFIGATLLTAYFSFNLPPEKEKDIQKVIATSDKFALNSKAALMFYRDDNTVRKAYQRFYMLGTNGITWRVGAKDRKTVTGGKNQKNDSHFIELMSAFAAYDFFNTEHDILEKNKDEGEVDYLFRTIDEDEKIRFNDFVAVEKKDELAKKLGVMVALSFLVGTEKYDFLMSAKNGALDNRQVQLNYDNIDQREIEGLKKYLHLFHFKEDANGIQDGWLRQIHRSAGGGDKFLFNPTLFIENGLSDFRFNKDLFRKDGEYSHNQFDKSLINPFGSMFDEFKKNFLSVEEPSQIAAPIERFIKHSYDTLVKLYNFN